MGPGIAEWFQFLKNTQSEATSPFLQKLASEMQVLQDRSKDYQAQQALKRTSTTPRHKQNKFQPGDFVLFRLSTDKPLPSKLTTRYQGPFEVIQQRLNDVECRNLITGAISTFYVEDLKLFIGDAATAKETAKTDQSQYDVLRILGYRGSPAARLTTEFEVEFGDGTVQWLPFRRDLTDTTQFEDFCRLRRELWPLLYTLVNATQRQREYNRSPVIKFHSFPTTVYVDLRYFGVGGLWYTRLKLPDQFRKSYVFEVSITGYVDQRTRKKVHAHFLLFDEHVQLDHNGVITWCYANVDPSFMIVINPAFAIEHPQIIPPNGKSATMQRLILANNQI
jgi:hypothetical protein